jgi:transposase
MINETRVLRLRRGDRAVLEEWTRSRTLQRRWGERARIVLAAAEGLSSRSIAQLYDVPRATVLLWTRRYEAEGIAGIQQDRPRSGRPRKMTADIEAAVIEKTVTETPPPEVATHWSTRLMAKPTGYTREAIGRGARETSSVVVRRGRGLADYLVRRTSGAETGGRARMEQLREFANVGADNVGVGGPRCGGCHCEDRYGGDVSPANVGRAARGRAEGAVDWPRATRRRALGQ